MLDELREQADSSEYIDDDEDDEAPSYFRMRYQSDRPLLGMTPGQRLFLAILLLITTCILGTSILLVLERVILPF